MVERIYFISFTPFGESHLGEALVVECNAYTIGYRLVQ